LVPHSQPISGFERARRDRFDADSAQSLLTIDQSSRKAHHTNVKVKQFNVKQNAPKYFVLIVVLPCHVIEPQPKLSLGKLIVLVVRSFNATFAGKWGLAVAGN